MHGIAKFLLAPVAIQELKVAQSHQRPEFISLVLPRCPFNDAESSQQVTC
jgi:hypothetical protein